MALDFVGWDGNRDDIARAIKPGVQDPKLDFIQQGGYTKGTDEYYNAWYGIANALSTCGLYVSSAKYLVDVLSRVEADQFSLELTGPVAPGLLRPLDGRDYLHVVMPVRTPS